MRPGLKIRGTEAAGPEASTFPLAEEKLNERYQHSGFVVRAAANGTANCLFLFFPPTNSFAAMDLETDHRNTDLNPCPCKWLLPLLPMGA